MEVIQVSATNGDGSARSLDGVDPPAQPPAAASAAKTTRASPEKKVRAALGCFAIAVLDVPLLHKSNSQSSWVQYDSACCRTYSYYVPAFVMTHHSLYSLLCGLAVAEFMPSVRAIRWPMQLSMHSASDQYLSSIAGQCWQVQGCSHNTLERERCTVTLTLLLLLHLPYAEPHSHTDPPPPSPSPVCRASQSH
jgi:hypothetical protein